MDKIPTECLREILSYCTEYAPAARAACHLWKKVIDTLGSKSRYPALTLCGLAARGHNELLWWRGKESIEHSTLNAMLRAAAEHGHVLTMQLLKEWGAGELDRALYSAARRGQTNAVKHLTENSQLEINDFNYALYDAARGNHLETVKFLVRYADPLIWGLRGAACGGHVNLMRHLVGSENTDTVFSSHGELLDVASSNGRIEVINFLIESGAKLEDWHICGAARGGHIGVMNFIIGRLRLDATWYDEALCAAAFGGHTEAMRLLISRGATGYKQALYEASYGGSFEAVRYLIECGATNSDEALDIATEYGFFDIIQLLKCSF